MVSVDKFPKYLVEVDYRGIASEPKRPSGPLWVTRLRDPFILARIDATENLPSLKICPSGDLTSEDRSKFSLRLVNQLAIAFQLPKAGSHILNEGDTIRAPDYIHMLKPGSEREYLLDTIAPRLWYCNQLSVSSKLTWISGFGKAPQFPKDAINASVWLAEQLAEYQSTKT